MRSGSQSNLYVEIPFVSEDDFGYDFGMEDSSAGRSEPLCRSQDATPYPEYIIRPNQIQLTAARLLHGRSPLGLATPVLADDLTAVARPARILQLICDERRVSQKLRDIESAAASSRTTLKADPPRTIESVATPSIARSQSSQRKRNIETPLARSLLKDFQRKFYRRRVVELALRNGLARRGDATVRRKPVPSA